MGSKYIILLYLLSQKRYMYIDIHFLCKFAGLACCQDCNFDANRTSNQRCGWSNDYEDDFDWSVRRLPTPTPFTGPSGDHTTGSK